jgi:hypothetical protein
LRIIFFCGECDENGSEPGQRLERRTPGWITAISFVLVPVATLLILLEVFGGAAGARNYLDATDISSKSLSG